MTSQGTAYGRFARAIRERHLQRAIMAAHELDHVTLANALELTILAAEVGDERWPKMAARWHVRFVDETPGIGVAESAFALSAANALGSDLGELAAQTLPLLAEYARQSAARTTRKQPAHP